MVGVGCQEASQNCLADAMKEISNSNRVRSGYSGTDGGICRAKVISRDVNPSKNQNEGISQVGGIDRDPKRGHSISDNQPPNFRSYP